MNQKQTQQQPVQPKKQKAPTCQQILAKTVSMLFVNR